MSDSPSVRQSLLHVLAMQALLLPFISAILFHFLFLHNVLIMPPVMFDQTPFSGSR